MVQDGDGRARSSWRSIHSARSACDMASLHPATVVDHIVPHRGDPKLFWDRSNWQALCKRCHDKKTRKYDSQPKYKR
ncbi:HNH endonuclease signature motif containing protein [Bilifractor sp. HCP3S3_D3]|uniref:HNH endonuclease signature motif containing protein n=1 Tax=Bilifractor sp. HCP3S3_D3 TaxID=3438907 RepID=UPI003F88DDD9